MRPKLSVCCITYNHGKYILDALQGFARQQTDFEFEVIIFDDCSTDNTSSAIRQFLKDTSQSYHLFENTTNVGMMLNFLAALKVCKGEYIALCEGDDYWTDPNKLQKQVDFLEMHPECSLCYHDVYNLEVGKNVEVNTEPSKTYSHRIDTVEELADGNFISTVSVIFKREVSEDLPSWFPNSPMGDFPLFMLAGKIGKLGHIKQTMAVYRTHGGIWTESCEVDRYINWIKLLRLLQNEFNRMPVVRARLLWSILRHQHLLLQKGCNDATGEVEKCIPEILESFAFIMDEYHHIKRAEKQKLSWPLLIKKNVRHVYKSFFKSENSSKA